MKKPTIREMKWLNKGFVKGHSYNRFIAKADDSLFLTESDESFELTCSIKQSSVDQGFIVSLTDLTYFSIAISEQIKITTSIKGYSSTVYFDIAQYLNNKSFTEFKMDRQEDTIRYYLKNKDGYQQVAQATLNGAKDAISFGFFLNSNIEMTVEDFSYIRKSQNN